MMAQRNHNNAAESGFQGSTDRYEKRTDPLMGEEEEILGKGAGAKASASAGRGSKETRAVSQAKASKSADGTAKDTAEALEAEASDDAIVDEAEAVLESAATESEALAAAQKEAADWQDRYMRLHAEWDTYRRRTSEQQAEEKKRATEKLIENLLPVLDDFERTVDYAETNGETGLLDGVKAVQAKLLDALVKGGLVVIDPVDQPYDALEAQAVATVPDPSVYDETVKEVYQKGYKLGKKVLRPAMVTVSTGGQKRPKDDE